jgi:Transposase IS4
MFRIKLDKKLLQFISTVEKTNARDIPENLTKKRILLTVVIRKLIYPKRIANPGHNLYFDHYFFTYRVFEVLKELKINAAGTLRVNRFTHPQFLSDKEMKFKGLGFSDEVESRDGKVNKPFFVGSTFVSKGVEKSVNRWGKTKKGFVSVQQPELIQLYNASMGGADLLA